MEGLLHYFKYLKPNSEYYGEMEIKEKEDTYQLSDIPDNYSVISDSDSIWKFYHVKDAILPEQGWKIHVTSLLEDSNIILEKVARLCIAKNIEFKHLKDKYSMLALNSKNANRASSGKFITIYPMNNEIFVELLEQISTTLQDFKKGPYILSDKRWKNSNVFYRYGGFKSIINEHGKYCIKDNKGNLIEDQRNPFYQVPHFVKDFDDYLNTINIVSDIDIAGDKRLEQYNIEKVLSFSNAGGVYLATRKQDYQKVIIKEARPNAGLDSEFQDALARQKIEYDALKKLESIPNVVNLIEHFQEWEHYFLVEEFIEGIDLQKWIAQNFPLYKGSNMHSHVKAAKKILLQLYTLIDKMHHAGVAMGDIQPANIIITEDLTVRIIDFETAMAVKSKEKPKLATPGFVSQDITISAARDWYGLKKLINYLALPILVSEDLESYLHCNHLNWIKNTYGYEFYHFLLDLQEKCDERIKVYQEYSPKKIILNHQIRNFNIASIINKLIIGIENGLTEDERFINGDIRQYEMSGGKFNFLTGGSGAAFTLMKNRSSMEEIDNWIKTFLLDNLHQIEDNGLFTGKTGILALLYEQGYQDIVLSELKMLKDTINKTDISLRSGLSGIGIFLISLYLETENTEYLDFSKGLEKSIEINRLQNESLKVTDWMAVDKGIIDGLSGVSLFYSALYSATHNKKYLEKAELLLKEDLKSAKKDDVFGMLQILDSENRLLPYLSGGSIGVAISIWFFNHVSGQNLYRQEMDAILKTSKVHCTISGSLFDGAGSFLLIPSMVKEGEYRQEILNDVLNLLHLFLIEKNDYYIYPGQFSYRLADDVYTGSSGIVLALMGVVKGNPLYWLPLINSEKFLARTKAKN
ncbi:class III lanthionine synthetase LanKC [Lysinibacillus sp. CD3-6]|uniref:class III lanthionine synthetase LanKC n=1 Tax=Lysinibacillus sp. CD3-6 TaxID=2892541 RepID=UPI001168E16E|nr:class III lanthionine synthetase LanKC [Lysinibacillus sp. CD3-6]UED81663.1 class III lanthionine synthetase LanKC [Lysinibacillus sp. CD3-6]